MSLGRLNFTSPDGDAAEASEGRLIMTAAAAASAARGGIESRQISTLRRRSPVPWPARRNWYPQGPKYYTTKNRMVGRLSVRCSSVLERGLSVINADDDGPVRSDGRRSTELLCLVVNLPPAGRFMLQEIEPMSMIINVRCPCCWSERHFARTRRTVIPSRAVSQSSTSGRFRCGVGKCRYAMPL